MPSGAASKLDAMMDRIEKMLARADHPNTPPEEADTARAMAETMMRKYRIEQEDLLKRGELKVDQFNVLFKDINAYPMDSEFGQVYRYLISAAINHAGCLGVWRGYVPTDDGTQYVLQAIGYEEDIRYAESLFMSARLVFADRMEPKPDPNLSDMENVYRMRSAGMERIRIANLMGWVKGGAKVTRLYKQACALKGEEPVLTGKGVDVKQYREAYAEAFWLQFYERLQAARNAADAEVSPGLQLHDREGRIKEAMYQRYPHLRPDPDRTPARKGNIKVRERKWTKADQRAAERRYSAASQAGRQAGIKAASEVDVRGTTPKRRLEEG